ncbi:MAG: ABC transporter substrate-binding protein [Alphaproteobacteria bacterium]|nr:ABC transporter substrate-binding protein [Alphaproteobacteria bacterium]
MKHAKLLTAFFVLFALLAPYAAAQAQTAPAAESASAVVKTFYAQLTDTMKQGEQLGFAGRFKKLEPAVRGAFNLPLMARVAAGPAWQKASPAEQEKLVESFSAFSVANYAHQFAKYDGETFDVLGEKPASGGGIIVETTLTPDGGAPVTLNYLVRNDDKGKPRIVDVYLDASISQLATRRSEFSAIIRSEGWDALIASLNEKTKKMGG